MTRKATTSRATGPGTATGTADLTAERIADLERRRAQAVVPGTPRGPGALGARERIERLLDEDSFTETGLFVRARTTGDGARRPYGDGVVTGYGTADTRPAETLSAWLLSGSYVPEVAARLHIHPQTVRYRLRQLEKLFGDALHDPGTRLDLILALRSANS